MSHYTVLGDLPCLRGEVTFALSETIATKNVFGKIDDRSGYESGTFPFTRQEVQLCH